MMVYVFVDERHSNPPNVGSRGKYMILIYRGIDLILTQ